MTLGLGATNRACRYGYATAPRTVAEGVKRRDADRTHVADPALAEVALDRTCARQKTELLTLYKNKKPQTSVFFVF